MFDELTNLEIQEITGGKNAVEVFVGCLEVAGGVVLVGSAGFTGVAGAAAVVLGDPITKVAGGYAILDGICDWMED